MSLSAEHDDPMEFLIAGFMVRDRLDPETLSRWRAAFHAEVKRRGGVLGDHYVTAIAKSVLAEITERATRRFRDLLVPGVREFADEDVIEELEVELSDILAFALKKIEER
jgi:hypothetical protein